MSVRSATIVADILGAKGADRRRIIATGREQNARARAAAKARGLVVGAVLVASGSAPGFGVVVSCERVPTEEWHEWHGGSFADFSAAVHCAADGKRVHGLRAAFAEMCRRGWR